MEPSEYLEHLRSDGEALAVAARNAPTAPVPSCPEWDMTNLVAHVGGVHRWVDQIVTDRAAEYVKPGSSDPEGFEATLDWYQEGLAQLLATLGGTDPDEPVWNWADRAPAPARFWWRRMAIETAVHRWDGEAAAGHAGHDQAGHDHGAHEHEGHDHAGHDHEGHDHAAHEHEAEVGAGADDAHPIAADLAADGIDEYIGFVGLWLPQQPVAGLHGSLHLHATDSPGEWSLFLSPDHLEHRREHIKSDAAIRGPVSDLLLWLLNRVPARSPRFQVFGDSEIVELWRQLQF